MPTSKAARSCAWSSRASAPEDEGFYQGAGFGWKRMVETLERVVVGLHRHCSLALRHFPPAGRFIIFLETMHCVRNSAAIRELKPRLPRKGDFNGALR